MVWPRVVNVCGDGLNHAWTSNEVQYFCMTCGYVYPDAVPTPEAIRRRRRARSRRNIHLITKRDGNFCSYCLKPFGQHRKPTVDHRVPKCKGGKSTMANLVAACTKCNNEKRDMDEEEYRQMIALRTGRTRRVPLPE